MTNIHLTDEDALKFIKFQKHYALIGLLDSLGAFDILNGSVQIHFDSQGKVGSVEVHKYFRPKTVDK